MRLDPSPLERWFTARPGPHRLSLASTAATAWSPAELAAWLPPGWERQIDWGYDEPQGDPALRALIAAELGLPDAAHVLLAAGAVEANFLALMTLLGPGDEAIVQTPAYPQLACVAAATGAKVVPWPLPTAATAAADAAALAALITPATRLVVLNTPHNPSGRVADAAALRAVVALVRAHPRAHLLVDEVYRGAGEALPPPSVLGLVGPERVVASDSTSKSWALPGTRVGWLAGDSAVLAAALVWREQASLALAGPATAAVRALWPMREEIRAANRAVVARNRAALQAWLAQRPWLQGAPAPQAACFLLGRADGVPLSDVVLADAWYREERVLAIPGTTVGFPGLLRVGFGHRDAAGLAAGLGFLDAKLGA